MKIKHDLNCYSSLSFFFLFLFYTVYICESGSGSESESHSVVSDSLQPMDYIVRGIP